MFTATPLFFSTPLACLWALAVVVVPSGLLPSILWTRYHEQSYRNAATFKTVKQSSLSNVGVVPASFVVLARFALCLRFCRVFVFSYLTLVHIVMAPFRIFMPPPFCVFRRCRACPCLSKEPEVPRTPGDPGDSNPHPHPHHHPATRAFFAVCFLPLWITIGPKKTPSVRHCLYDITEKLRVRCLVRSGASPIDF